MLACVFLSAAVAAASPSIPWIERRAEAMERAAAERRPVFVDVGAVWCAPCRQMEATTFRDPSVVGALGAFVPLKVDADAQPVFVERYRVEAFPTYLLLDGEGLELARLTGYQDAASLREALGRVVEGYDVYAGSVGARGDPRAQREAAAYLRRVGNPGRAVELLRWASRLNVDLPPAEREVLEVELAAAQVEAGDRRSGLRALKKLAGSARDPAARAAAQKALDEAGR